MYPPPDIPIHRGGSHDSIIRGSPDWIQSANVPPILVFLSFNFSYLSWVRCFFKSDLLSESFSFFHNSSSGSLGHSKSVILFWIICCSSWSCVPNCSRYLRYMIAASYFPLYIRLCVQIVKIALRFDWLRSRSNARRLTWCGYTCVPLSVVRKLAPVNVCWRTNQGLTLSNF